MLPVIGSLITLVCYLLTIQRVRGYQRAFEDLRSLRVKRLLLYPTVIFVSFLPSVFYWIFLYNDDEEASFVFEAIKMVLANSLGFTNALVYSYQKKLYATPKNSVQRRVVQDEFEPQSENRGSVDNNQFL